MKTKATNAIEAKVITDNYLKWLSPKRCANLFKGGETCLYMVSSNISYRIGASAYYYGKECKEFCSEIIHRHIITGLIAHVNG